MNNLITDEKIREIASTLLQYSEFFSPSAITLLNSAIVMPLPVIEFARLIESEVIKNKKPFENERRTCTCSNGCGSSKCDKR